MIFRKTFEIVGWTIPGAAFCLDCVPSQPEDDEAGPVFLESANDLTCDCCFEYLDGEDHCSCGGSLDDGEGWDGRCGNCADKAEAPYAWTFKISYVDPDGDWEPEGGYTYTGDCTRVTFLYKGEEIDTLDFSDGQELVEEIEYWLFEADPEA